MFQANLSIGIKLLAVVHSFFKIHVSNLRGKTDGLENIVRPLGAAGLEARLGGHLSRPPRSLWLARRPHVPLETRR